jgi:hypothetical protein
MSVLCQVYQENSAPTLANGHLWERVIKSLLFLINLFLQMSF